MGFPSELVIEKTGQAWANETGEVWDNATLALASYTSTDDAFLGIKIWHLDYNIDPDGEEWLDLENVEVLVFTKRGDLELRELVLQANGSVKGNNLQIWVSSANIYNLKLVRQDLNGNSVLVFSGVGYSNRTGFTGDGRYTMYDRFKSSIYELNVTITLSYARGPFGFYGTTEVSTSLKITVRD
ncbi:MAG: hypothetical protein OEY22_10370 [Candidatus Bathyarchaeota archaeon]|nr:hypothetical protein [Candidatus Bathyarchaeota archaeon]MDH5787770.1 hypothetical protein [Candidatus Bathyarchaeota archaeon]